MDSIGEMLNPIGKMPKNTLQKIILYWFYWKKLMVHNGILMESIGISVMVSIRILLFFSRVFFLCQQIMNIKVKALYHPAFI